MLQPTDKASERSRAVRDGQLAAVTCAACGCRLERGEDVTTWFHFGRGAGRDARGCRVECTDAAHDAGGRPLLAA
jgi:hypothetical protein